MSNEKPEVRGAKLFVGAVILITLTYWFVTGKVIEPLVGNIFSDSVQYANPLNDGIDVLTAVAYWVGSGAVFLMVNGYKLVGSITGTLRSRFADDKVEVVEPEGVLPQLVDTVNSLVEEVQKLKTRLPADGASND